MTVTLNSAKSHELIGTEVIYNYMTGGHAVVTLQSDISGIYHTYNFRKPDGQDKNNDTMFIFTLVSGSEWVYVGMYKNRDFHFTAKSKFKADSAIVKGVAFIIRLMLQDGFSNPNMHLYHEGICSRCGRPLTNPASIALGIGPTCAEMMYI